MLKAAGRPLPHEEKSDDRSVLQIAVDRKIVPFERVPDHAGGNDSVSLCGVHVTPVFAVSGQLGL
jgi:hypothetical protein